jgi:hypothetical protein
MPFFDESVTARVSTLTALLVPLLAFAQHAPPARPFQPFDGCIYKPQRLPGSSFLQKKRAIHRQTNRPEINPTNMISN